MTTRQIIKEVINQSLGFISRLEIKNEFQLFERSEPTPYARCFIIFIRALCKDTNWIEQKRAILNEDLNLDFNKFYHVRKSQNQELKFDKPI